MFRDLERQYTDNTQHGVANDLALRICSAAKESLNDNENTFPWVASLGRKSQSQKPLSLPSRLYKCHCCTPQNGAIFSKFPNWAFSSLVSRHGAITFAAQCQTSKNPYKSGRMPEGCEQVVSPLCPPSASPLPPFCLRYGTDKRLDKMLIYRAITDQRTKQNGEIA